MQDYMPYMQMMGLPNHCCPMMEMPQGQLESMYPKTYHTIYPHVKHHCDMFDNMHGMTNPSNEQLEAMVDDIQRKVEFEIDVDVNVPCECGNRQFGYGGRRLLRDLISILLIRQLLQRRRPFPYGGYPYQYPYQGYYGNVYGYGVY